MPTLTGMAQSSLETLLKSIVSAPSATFDGVPADVLEKAGQRLISASKSPNKNEVHVYGFVTCPWYQKALKMYVNAAPALGWTVLARGHANRAEYKAWLAEAQTKAMLSALSERAARHTSSPLCIIGNNFIGGHDDSVKFVENEKAKTVPARGANEVHVYGFITCVWYQKALKMYVTAAPALGWKIVARGHASRAEYKAWLAEAQTKAMLSALSERAAKHTSSPLCIIGNNFIGGHDDSVKFVTSEKAKIIPAPVATIKIDPVQAKEKIAGAIAAEEEDEACFT